MSKHMGLITSDEAEKLYSYPTLPAAGDSDCTEYLCGNGTFDHPHVEYGATEPPQIATNWSVNVGNYFKWGLVYTDKYGHVIRQQTCRYRYVAPSGQAFVTDAQVAKINAYPSPSAGTTLKFDLITLADDINRVNATMYLITKSRTI